MKNINFKSNKYSRGLALGILLFFVSASCSEDFLDRSPRALLTQDSFFQTEDQAIQAVNAIYSHLRAFDVHVFSYIGLTDIASDDADKGSVPGDAAFLEEVSSFTLDSNNGAINGIWVGYFRGIFRANQVLINLPEIEMNEELRARLTAEARFLRGYFYFFLTRTYGDLPLLDRPLNPDEYFQDRVDQAQVYEFIIQDFQFAVDNLPEKSQYPAEDLGRATKGAARGFLAKVYLFNDDFTNANRLAEDVINSGEYGLYPNYEEIFRPEGEHSSESLFEVGAVSLEQGGGGHQFNEVQGVRGSPNLGWGFNRPSDDLENSYEEGDPRKNATIIFDGDTLPNGEIVEAGDNMGDNPKFNKKAWIPIPPGGMSNSGHNIRLLRYADILLIAAESANEIGNSAQALMYINMIRERARGAMEDVLPELAITDSNELREAIRRERRAELAMEQHRYFDLVRWGIAQETFAALGINWMPGKHEVFPIPQVEIDLSGGRLNQNPGY